MCWQRKFLLRARLYTFSDGQLLNWKVQVTGKYFQRRDWEDHYEKNASHSIILYLSLKIKALSGKSKPFTWWWWILLDMDWLLCYVLCFSTMFCSFCPSSDLNSVFLHVHRNSYITFNGRPYCLIIKLLRNSQRISETFHSKKTSDSSHYWRKSNHVH